MIHILCKVPVQGLLWKIKLGTWRVEYFLLLFYSNFTMFEQWGTMKKMGERRGKEEMKELEKIFWNAVCMVKRGKSQRLEHQRRVITSSLKVSTPSFQLQLSPKNNENIVLMAWMKPGLLPSWFPLSRLFFPETSSGLNSLLQSPLNFHLLREEVWLPVWSPLPATPSPSVMILLPSPVCVLNMFLPAHF